MPSKKLRGLDRGGKRAPLPRGQTAKGVGFRRGAIRADQLAPKTLLPDGVSSTLDRETRLRVDLSVRGARTHERGEFLYVPARDGRRMPRGIPGGALEEIPRSSPPRRTRRGAKPSLRANSASGEHKLPQAPTTLAGVGPGGEMVSRVQAKFVEQDVRERGPNTRCVDQDAWPVLGETFPPQAAHRILMVGKGGGGDYMTSIDRTGITERVMDELQPLWS